MSLRTTSLLSLLASFTAQAEEVVYPTRQNGVSKLADRLAVTTAETYCWMFTNPQSTPTVITLDLQLNPD